MGLGSAGKSLVLRVLPEASRSRTGRDGGTEGFEGDFEIGGEKGISQHLSGPERPGPQAG